MCGKGFICVSGEELKVSDHYFCCEKCKSEYVKLLRRIFGEKVRSEIT